MLIVTPAHAFRLVSPPSEGSGEVWRAAGQLEKGAQLRSINGIVSIDSVFTESVSPTAVISYEVEGGLDYVVGEMPVVVQKACDLRTVYDAIGNVADKTNFNQLIHDIKSVNGKYAEFIEQLAKGKFTGNQIKQLQTLISKADFKPHLAGFIEDFGKNSDFATYLINNTSRIDAWKLAKTSGLDDALHTNPHLLSKLTDVWVYDFVTTGNRAICPNIKLLPTQLTLVSDAVLTQMRNTFNSSVRADFLKNLGNSSDIADILQKAGFKNSEIPIIIQDLQNGNMTKLKDFAGVDFQVHHKIPLKYGGTNNFSNLILIKHDPYHKAMTGFQNSRINLTIGQTQTLDFPQVQGNFYSPPYIN